jgi:hypothetical protein
MYLNGMHNLSVSRTACKVRLQIPSAALPVRRPLTSNVSERLLMQ